MFKKNIAVLLSLMLCVGFTHVVIAQDAAVEAQAAAVNINSPGKGSLQLGYSPPIQANDYSGGTFAYPDSSAPKNMTPNSYGPFYSFVAASTDMGFAFVWNASVPPCDAAAAAAAADASGYSTCATVTQSIMSKMNQGLNGITEGGLFCVARSFDDSSLSPDQIPNVLNRTMFAALLKCKTSAGMGHIVKAIAEEYFDFVQMYFTSIVGIVNGVKNMNMIRIKYSDDGVHGWLVYNTLAEECIVEQPDKVFGNNLLAKALVSVTDMASFINVVTPPGVRGKINNFEPMPQMVCYFADKDVDLSKKATDTTDYTQSPEYFPQNVLFENISAMISTDKVGYIYYSTDTYAEKANPVWEAIFNYEPLMGNRVTCQGNVITITYPTGSESAELGAGLGTVAWFNNSRNNKKPSGK